MVVPRDLNDSTAVTVLFMGGKWKYPGLELRRDAGG